MVLENKLGIKKAAELVKQDEKISKLKAIEIFENDVFEEFDAGRFETLAKIHKFLFDEIYYYAGEVREIDITKGNFKFTPVIYLNKALENIDKMPQSTFDEIVEKYVEMNLAHPFREANGRAARIWLNLLLKQELHKIVDWSQVDKGDYLLAMKHSSTNNDEIKEIFKEALSTAVNDQDVYMSGIDASYSFDGYFTYKTKDLYMQNYEN